MKKHLLLAFLCIAITFTVTSQVTQRMPLFEEFTSSTCPPCATNNPVFDGMLEDNPGEFVCIKYQMNWPGAGDDYYNTDGNSRRGFYGVSGIPDLYVDGVAYGLPGYYTQSDFNNEQTNASPMVIHAYYELDGTDLTVYGDVQPLQTISGTSIRIMIGVVESVTFNNASTNGEDEFYYVEQKMIPNAYGTIITGVNAGATIPFTKTYDLSIPPNIEDMDNLLYAVWVQNYSTKEVYQSTWATLATGVQEVENSASGIISISPNPTSDAITISYLMQESSEVTISVYSAIGQLIESNDIGMSGFGLHRETIETDHLPSGVYVAEVKVGENIYRQNLVVQ